MPKIDPKVLHSVFFLYAVEDDARLGRNARGTGFLVGYDGDIYGVTNRHVARDSGASTIRLRSRVGFEVINLSPEDWEIIPGGDDVAATNLPLDARPLLSRPISANEFVEARDDDIGVGENVFMLGLFVDHALAITGFGIQ